MKELATELAVETAIRKALLNLGCRIVVPSRRSLCSLEVAACVQLVPRGEPGPICEGRLILTFLVRCSDCRVRDPDGLCLRAARAAWGTEDPGAGTAMKGGYQGWEGPVPSVWLDRVSS